jgi:hypothetical protein
MRLTGVFCRLGGLVGSGNGRARRLIGAAIRSALLSHFVRLPDHCVRLSRDPLFGMLWMWCLRARSCPFVPVAAGT